jgi:hypothetical protein
MENRNCLNKAADPEKVLRPLSTTSYYIERTKRKCIANLSFDEKYY